MLLLATDLRGTVEAAMRYTIAWDDDAGGVELEIPDETLVRWTLEHIPSRTAGSNPLEAAELVLAANGHLRQQLVAAYVGGLVTPSSSERIAT